MQPFSGFTSSPTTLSRDERTNRHPGRLPDSGACPPSCPALTFTSSYIPAVITQGAQTATSICSDSCPFISGTYPAYLLGLRQQHVCNSCDWVLVCNRQCRQQTGPLAQRPVLALNTLPIALVMRLLRWIPSLPVTVRSRPFGNSSTRW